MRAHIARAVADLGLLVIQCRRLYGWRQERNYYKNNNDDDDDRCAVVVAKFRDVGSKHIDNVILCHVSAPASR